MSKQKKRKNYDLQKDAHNLSVAQLVVTVGTGLLLGNYYLQATKQANPTWANEMDYKKKQWKKKAKATVYHIFRRDVVTDIEEDN